MNLCICVLLTVKQFTEERQGLSGCARNHTQLNTAHQPSVSVYLCQGVFVCMFLFIFVYCSLCGGETRVARNHTQLSTAHQPSSHPAETREAGIMNQMGNKKAETNMNQRIISAERALFLPLSLVVADQLLTQSIKTVAADVLA